MIYCYFQPCGRTRKTLSLAIVAATWFLIIRFSLGYIGTPDWERGTNVFDLAYVDVIWGGENGNWGFSQALLCWAAVATVWSEASPAFFQVFGMLGAMSGSYSLWVPPEVERSTISVSYLLWPVLAFPCIWALPKTSEVQSLSWWLW